MITKQTISSTIISFLIKASIVILLIFIAIWDRHSLILILRQSIGTADILPILILSTTTIILITTLDPIFRQTIQTFSPAPSKFINYVSRNRKNG